MSLEINKGDITLPTRRSFLKVLYNVCQIRKKDITFEQYYRIHIHGSNIAICEITSDTVFVLNSAFTTKDNYFQVAIDDAIDAFNAVLLDFGYTQQLQKYDRPPIKFTHSPNTRFGPKTTHRTIQTNHLSLTIYYNFTADAVTFHYGLFDVIANMHHPLLYRLLLLNSST